MSQKQVPKRQYTDEFKDEAIRLAESVGQHEATRRLGVPVATLGNWSRRSRGDKDMGEVGSREVLLHCDRGSQYASRTYRKLATDFKIDVSMSRRVNARDNAPIESFFKTLKVERIYQVHYETRARARLDIVDWIEGYYNRQHLHTSIDFHAPVDYETGLIAA